MAPKNGGDFENAKRRTLFILDVLGFPFRTEEQVDAPELKFEFKADGKEPVMTGHHAGCITINIKEADPVEREKLRVNFNEPHRTLVGHFRHELGHYYWDRLVQGKKEFEFREQFGDERDPSYQKALSAYYENGPAENWRQNFVSAYASMHPWEDFAESFNVYLDMLSVLFTADHFEVVRNDLQDFDRMLTHYAQVGMIVNEINRDMGLIDLVPEVFGPQIKEKLRFIHQLRTQQEVCTGTPG
ncbi:MAG: putative zinc-binding metallopeptidase [Planctomycetaceae bacterium]